MGGIKWPLVCPVCNARLEQERKTLECSAGHTFDIAREGYVNLLLSNHRRRAVDGDTADMLRSRRRFLEAGYYRPLYELLATMIAETYQNNNFLASEKACIFEVGSGEGYYIGNITRELHQSMISPKFAFMGMDLSKAAARFASKRYQDTLFFVGDIHRRVYVQDTSVNVLLNIFSPRNVAEFARILAPKGCILIVIPAESHLSSLRTTLNLLDIQVDKERQTLARFVDDFSLVDRRVLHYPLELPATAVADLVNMGPNHWHRLDKFVESNETITATEASFIVLHLQRKHARTR